MKNHVKDLPTAGILIIGDEILKGQVQDVNTHFLTQKLYDFGVKVERITVLPDQVDIVAKEVANDSSSYTYVITSGGIGPTHDDITFEAVAAAFDDQVGLNEEIATALKLYFKAESLNEGMAKLATIPKTAKLNFAPGVLPEKKLQYPLVSVKNVYIFPGVPELLKKLFNSVGSHIFNHSDLKRITHEHFVTETEIEFTTRLNQLVRKYSDEGVVFGSYPAWVNNYYKAKLTIEAASEDLLQKVGEDIRMNMKVIDGYDHEPNKNAWNKLEQFLEKSTDADFVLAVRDAISTIQECFTRYKRDEVMVAFNGGKDCIVILHLAFAFLQEHKLLEKDQKLHVLYVKDDDPFPEVTDFIEMSRKAYNLDIIEIQRPMKEGLARLLSVDRPHIRAAILGTRHGDPNAASQDKFCPTDGDWPPLMRVNPILTWNYGYIWTFIRGLQLPYPTLYDRGYTSLGDRRNTLPNPSLAVTDDAGNVTHKPAYLLEDGCLERHGRK